MTFVEKSFFCLDKTPVSSFYTAIRVICGARDGPADELMGRQMWFVGVLVAIRVSV